jgi:hypothetical protein
MRSARSGKGRRWLPGKIVKLPLSGSVTSVSRYDLDRERPAGLADTDGALRLAAVGMGIAGEGLGRGAHDRLAHRELDVRAHQVEDEVEHARPVDQVDERLVIGEQVAAIHEGFRIGVGMIDPGIVATRQLARRRLVARLPPHAVDLFGEEIDFRRAERAFELQVAVDGPLLALRLGQSPCGVGQHAVLPVGYIKSPPIARRPERGPPSDPFGREDDRARQGALEPPPIDSETLDVANARPLLAGFHSARTAPPFGIRTLSAVDRAN